jgi:predicted RNase H-like HicB family nuclease
MAFTIELEQEDDGRWLAEVLELPGVLAYGQSRQEATERVEVLTLRVLAEQADLSPDAACSLLRLAFGAEDRERMRQLSELVQERDLTEAEQAEVENYRRVSRLLDLIHSKARLSLQRQGSGERAGNVWLRVKETL